MPVGMSGLGELRLMTLPSTDTVDSRGMERTSAFISSVEATACVLP